MATCREPEGWRIVSLSRDFDLTLCFEEGFILSSLYTVLAISSLLYSLSVCLSPPNQLARRSRWLLAGKLFFLIDALLISLANIFFIVWTQRTVPVTESYILEPISIVGAIFLTYFHHTRARHSSTILLVYWPLHTAAIGIWTRTILAKDLPDYRLILALKAASTILGLASFLVECVGPAEPHPHENPVITANIFSIWYFSWMTPLMKKGATQYVVEDDLPSLVPSDDSERLSEKLEAALIKHSLWKALFVAYGGPYAFAGMLKIFQDSLVLLQPQLLRLLLTFISTYQAARFNPVGEERVPSPLQGFLIAFTMFLAGATQTIVLNQYFQRCFETGLRVRAGLVSAIYKKALVLSNDERGRSSGDIVNYMSVDAARLQEFCTYGFIAISGPFQITIAFISLYKLLGWPAFVGVGVMILSIPLNTFMARVLKNLQKEQMENRDKRTRIMSEVLANIKSIKLYAWEFAFMRKVLQVRNDMELKTLRRAGIIRSFNTMLWGGIPSLVGFSSFAVAAITRDEPLSADVIFPALSLFMILQFPLAMFGQVTSNIVEAIVSIKRLSDFLNADELQPDARKIVSRLVPNVGDELLSIKGGDFSWAKDAAVPTLEDINISVKKGQLVGVFGKVGCGKTSLLSAIIGDMTRREGEVILRGSISYSPQNPWILSASVRDNILFSHEYDETFYNLVLEACALGPDIALLAQGDLTEVGEKGITAVANALELHSLGPYTPEQIWSFSTIVWLLLTAMSLAISLVFPSAFTTYLAHGGIDNVIGPQGLLAKTGSAVIFVTNSISFVRQFDHLLFIRRGIILESGSYPVLAANTESELSRLLRGFGSSNSSGASTPFITSGPATPQIEAFGDKGDELSAHVSEKLRQATISKATLAAPPPVRSSESTDLSKEHSEKGQVKTHVYTEYIKAASRIGFIFFMLAIIGQQAASVAATLSLRQWGEHNREAGGNTNIWWFLGIYGILSLTQTLLGGTASLMMQVFCSLRSARKLHDSMLDSLMRAPLSFFELTPTGRTLNLFSRDVYTLDSVLANVISNLARTGASSLFIIIVIGSSFPLFLVFIPPIAWFYIRVMKYYLATSRELKRLDSVSRSPIFAWFSESLAGLSTIRAFNQQPIFVAANQRRLDRNQICYLSSISVNRWLSVRLEISGAVITSVVACLAVIALITQGVDAGLVGLVLSYAMNATSSLNWLVRSASEVEQNIVSVERILHQTNVAPEAPQEIPEAKPAGVWPSHGAVEFKNYSMRYRPELELVLKSISMQIKPKEKVGVCGRTGAGKSSLLLALFRIIEATEGSIIIDGVDISTVGLHDLRSGISIVPQSPDLFEATLRENIDPVGEHSDADIWVAIEQAHLKSYVESLPERLDAPVREGGQSLSSGQRQLLCFARALLRKSKVLVLDEATSAVDLDTDKAIQDIIRGPAFADVTILTIAHRLNTIIDSDRVLVMDTGKVAEFDSPAALLAKSDSIFASLCREARLTAEEGESKDLAPSA